MSNGWQDIGTVRRSGETKTSAGSYRTEDESKLYAGIVVDIAEESLNRAQALLGDIEGGWQRAVGSALARAAASGQTVAARAATKEYALSQATFRQSTRNINHYVRDRSGEVESIVFGFRGKVIPLIKFATGVGTDGRVRTRVRRTGSAEALDYAFLARMGEHRGIYERETSQRFPVKELFGPSTPQMMNANDAVTEEMEDRMVEVYEERIEHEITRLLNGWGDKR